MKNNRWLSFLKFRTFLLVLCLTFSFTGHLFAQEEVTTITILNARQTEYKKDEESGNDSILLEGSVQISVQKGNSISEINADKITYDRKTEMLFAEGNVEIITKSSSEGGEKSTASSLLMNTSTLEGVFNDGRVVQTQSDALNLPSGSTLIVFSDIFGKSESNTIAFKNSSLTFCDDENPHWHIDATRTWLLPGGEFAFFNALLYIGPIPVFYFPAFYYPKDELIFNPVFGFSNKKGYYFQTTTYFYGRKPLEETSSSSSTTGEAGSESLKSLYNFMKPSTLKKQERQGLVLHNLDENFTGSTNEYIKMFADWYSNLGGMVGVKGALAGKKGIIKNFNFDLDLGFSNTVFYDRGIYSPFSTKGIKYSDKSDFLGLKLPFRYSGNFDISITKPFSLSFSFPIYSDPYFNSDFFDRSETMDWISLLTSSNKEDETISEISSYNWKISGSYSPTIADILKPYVSSFSISSSSTLNISSAQNVNINNDSRAKNSDSWISYSPERKFYYPTQLTPVSANLSLSGTLYEYPVKDYRTVKKVDFPVALNKPDSLKSQAEIKKEAEETALVLLKTSGENWLSLIGSAIIFAGTILEIIADVDMRNFLKTTKEKVTCQHGLWKYSRHPNYLGENMVWFGIYVALVVTIPSMWWLCVGTVIMILLFRRRAEVFCSEKYLCVMMTSTITDSMNQSEDSLQSKRMRRRTGFFAMNIRRRNRRI